VTTQLVPAPVAPALRNAVALWADATTAPATARRADSLRNKMAMVGAFFTCTAKPPEQVTEIDVKAWQAELEGRGLATATVYGHVSRLFSFYQWALQDPALAQRIGRNPVRLARPKAPRAYQTESTQALSDEELAALLQVVKRRADAGDLVGLRNYAMLLFYALTGMRRAEIASLRWGDVRLGGTLTITAQVKGGQYQSREVADPAVQAALVAYLRAAGRWGRLAAGDPLWVRHDRAGGAGAGLTSHGFVKNLKRYGRAAGLAHIHLHQTRHTYARLVGELTGSVVETQDALGHKNASSPRVYLQRVAVKRDKHSRGVAQRLGV
jgi:integrase